MSVSPLPVHTSCYGVSSDAVSLARYGGAPKSTYADKLSAARASYVLASTAASAPQAAPTGQASGGASQAAAAPYAASHRAAPSINPQPLAPHQASQLLGGGGGGHAAGGAQSCGVSSTRAMDLSKSKHQPMEPALQAMDFASIADSSTGGNGVPRPYGRFTAARGANGNATWQRLPPAPGSWQAKALPLAVTVLTDEEAAAAEAAVRQSSAGRASTSSSADDSAAGSGSPSGRFGAARHAHSTGRLRQPLRGLAPATYPGLGAKPQTLEKMAAAASSQAAAMYDTSSYRRPGSGIHRVMALTEPPEPQGWFALPAATFLSGTPTLPANVRTDCGFSIGRDFLKSGLPGVVAQQEALAAQQVQERAAAFAAQAQAADLGREHGHGHGHEQAHVASADKDLLLSVLRGSSSVLASPKGSPSARSGGDFRGVYVPIDNSVREQQLATQPEWLGGAPRYGVGSLPAEVLLPRRNAPPKW